MKARLPFGRIALALTLASIAGGAAVGLEVLVAMIVVAWSGSADAGEVATAAIMALMLGLSSVAFAAAAFAVGLVVVGWPVWLALHALGVRRWWAAAVAGAVLATTAGLALLTVNEGAPPDPDMIRLATFLILPGAIAGWTLYRIAYGGRTSAA